MPSAAFKLNDSVTILKGKHVGQHAAIISLEALEQEPHYLVELAGGAGDVILRESELEPAECETDIVLQPPR